MDTVTEKKRHVLQNEFLKTKTTILNPKLYTTEWPEI